MVNVYSPEKLWTNKYKNATSSLFCSHVYYMSCSAHIMLILEPNDHSFSSFSVISINQVNVNNNNFTWALISRRSVNRAGTRLFCRGIDINVSTCTTTFDEEKMEYLSNDTKINYFPGSLFEFRRNGTNC